MLGGRGPHRCALACQEVGLALRTLLATVDETMPVLPASTHREVGPGPRPAAGRCGRAGTLAVGRASQSRSVVAMAVLPAATPTRQPVALRTV